jgi:hypothetical protein
LTIKKLSEKRQGFLGQNAERLRGLTRLYLPGVPEGETAPWALDFLLAGWMDDPARTPLKEKEVVSAIACAFGQYLADNYGFCWVVVSSYGEGAGLAVMKERPEIHVFPVDIIEKGVDAGERGFLEPVHRLVLSEISQAFGPCELD